MRAAQRASLVARRRSVLSLSAPKEEQITGRFVNASQSDRDAIWSGALAITRNDDS
jgi:hypothetical protein